MSISISMNYKSKCGMCDTRPEESRNRPKGNQSKSPLSAREYKSVKFRKFQPVHLEIRII